MAISNYLTDSELVSYISGNDEETANQNVYGILSTSTNGIEGLPYQFMESVDRRILDSSVGRKYGERIFARLPLLFLTPCEPLFMDDFSKTSRELVVSQLLGNTVSNLSELINSGESGRYYSVDFNYAEYYDYLNVMLSAVSVYMGLYNETITINGSSHKIGTVDWSSELNNSFKTFFSSKENVIFYLDGMTSVDESFTNDTTESSLASTINGFADQAREIRYLFGNSGNAAAELVNSASDVTTSITSSLSGVASSLGGGIVQSLSNKGVNTVLNGGKIVFPEVWSDSKFSRSYSLEVKLRSPDHDNLSIFLNIIKPYCKILCLTMPRQVKNSEGEYDPNGYNSPFLVKAYSKGLFNIDMGIIDSLSVRKGDVCCWNDDGLPTQIDISISIKDLYSNLFMSTYDYLHPVNSLKTVCNNTSYMDFLANMAGLNIGQMEVGRRITMFYYLSKNMISGSAAALYRRFDQQVSKYIGKLYNIL